jgi:hypothetical protein
MCPGISLARCIGGETGCPGFRSFSNATATVACSIGRETRCAIFRRLFFALDEPPLTILLQPSCLLGGRLSEAAESGANCRSRRGQLTGQAFSIFLSSPPALLIVILDHSERRISHRQYGLLELELNLTAPKWSLVDLIRKWDHDILFRPESSN